MILPDVNVLVYAAHEGAHQHARYAEWLNQTVRREELLLPDAVVSGVLRILTNARIVLPSVSMESALNFTDAIRTGRLTRSVEGSRAVWSRFAEICGQDHQIRGKLVPDAYLAAVALTHNARLATRDRGFARFSGLRWFNPADQD